jgi:aspartate carbamoyltransferase catalytic subunit
MARILKHDLVSIDDLSLEEIERIFELADEFAAALERGDDLTFARGLVMATLFYEPSTRTRLSFESAMHRLGGAVISSADMQASSAAKGESLADTVRVVAAYADLLVVRHPNDGAARVAAEYASVPVINAGDGSREHPTQTLCDLYILRRKKGRLKGLTVAICGDLKFGRTVHSLIYALARFGANIVTVPYGGMDVPEYVLGRVAAEHEYALSSITIDELRLKSGALDALYLTPSGPHQMALFTDDALLVKTPVAPPSALDAFYVTRLQRERFASQDDPAGAYVRFDARALRSSRTQQAVVLHPLPRTDELAYELDQDPRAVYFEQAAAGVPVRMALIAWMIESGARQPRQPTREPLISFKHEAPPRCVNASCISRHEPAYLTPRFRLARSPSRAVLALRCDLCERELRAEYVGHTTAHRYYHFDENLYGYVQQWIAEGAFAVFETVKEAEERGYEPYRRGPQRELMNAAEIERACRAIADQIVAEIADPAVLTIVGVISRGAILAARLRDLLQARSGVLPACAALDVYAGGAGLRGVAETGEEFNVDNRIIVLVDDVINSGWTVQRAMTALWRYGRPASVKLAVLIDRGHRAVPIRPNYVGKSIPTAQTDRVQVRLRASDRAGRKLADRVVIYSMVEPLVEAGAAR